MFKKTERPVRLFSFADDQAHEERGSLIPRRGAFPKHTFTPRTVRASWLRLAVPALAVFLLVFVFGVAGVVGVGLLSQSNLASVPTVTIVSPYSEQSTTLTYGPQPALAKDALFIDTRNAFIDEGLSFIEVDVTQRQLRYFRNGVLYQSAEIMAVGADGSWWEVPSGLYKISKKDERTFSSVGQLYLPWQLSFQGNFVIHGVPTLANGVAVADDFVGGGIRLSNEAAEELYRNVRVATPVIVHASGEEKPDTFVYEPLVPDLDTPHYFIADIGNGTVLAATDLDDAVPIASLTKLMTAVVAAEEIDLNGRVRVTSPTFVTSLIPRLADRSTVSMYSLLQLLLVESSNEAAETIAGELGRNEFIEAMNAKARQLGMLGTHFADPSGLSAENVSSVGDLYTLAKYIYDNRSFIFEMTANGSVPSAYVGNEFEGLMNFNEVKGLDNFIGGKVGETQAAGQTSVSLHRVTVQGEERVVVVILLGSDSRTEDVEALVSYVQQRYGR